MDHVNTLFEKFKNNECTPEEVEQLLTYFQTPDHESILKESITRALEEEVDHASGLHDDADLVYQRLQPQLLEKDLKIIRMPVYRWMAAASVVIIAIAGTYIFRHKSGDHQLVSHKPASVKHQILHDPNKATLTLGNGQQVVLAGVANGTISTQGATQVIKNAGGQLTYHTGQTGQAGDLIAENTITVPRGGQYRVILSDGTSVFLNAASSLTYPTAFSGQERRVTLRGEAYFEVAKNKAKPFIVTADAVDVKVLGTHFNISAYSDDPAVATTLLEGSVSLTKGTTVAMLKPGEQGIAAHDLQSIKVQKADLDQAMAWTTGNFVFNDLNIKEVMKIVSRWYDVDVEYRGDVQFRKFGGSTPRSNDIIKLLNYMKITGNINYKIEARRVILMN